MNKQFTDLLLSLTKAVYNKLSQLAEHVNENDRSIKDLELELRYFKTRMDKLESLENKDE